MPEMVLPRRAGARRSKKSPAEPVLLSRAATSAEVHAEHAHGRLASGREQDAGTTSSNPPSSGGSLRTFGSSAEDAGFISRLECRSSDSKIDRPGIGIDPVRPGQLHFGTGANGSELAAGHRTTSELV